MTELNEVTYGGEVGSECHGGDQRWLVSPFSVSPSRVVQSRARETVRRVMICFTFVVLACSLSPPFRQHSTSSEVHPSEGTNAAAASFGVTNNCEVNTSGTQFQIRASNPDSNSVPVPQTRK